MKTLHLKHKNILQKTKIPLNKIQNFHICCNKKYEEKNLKKFSVKNKINFKKINNP